MAESLKIAVLRALHLGDLLVAVPALRSLRAGFPGAEITLIGLPWAESFVQRYRHLIDRFLPFPGFPGMDEIEADSDRAEWFFAEQRLYGYDIAVQMHGSGRTSNAFVLELEARWTVGYYEGDRPTRMTAALQYPSESPEIKRNLGLSLLLGCPNTGAHLEFPLNDDDHVEALSLLDMLRAQSDSRSTLRPLIGIHSGAKRPAQRWAAERFAATADAMVETFGAEIILTGGPNERPMAEQVAGAMRHEPLIAAGRTSLGALGALIAHMHLFVSNDTGPAHLADAVGTRTIRLFGPGDYTRWAPLDRSDHIALRHPVICSPCGFWECPIDHRCLLAITPEQVLHSAEQLLSLGATV